MEKKQPKKTSILLCKENIDKLVLAYKDIVMPKGISPVPYKLSNGEIIHTDLALISARNSHSRSIC